MSGFAKTATELYREVAFSEKENLPHHSHEQVEKVIDEVKYHHNEMQRIMAAASANEGDVDWSRNPEDAGAVLVHYHSLLRNKRLLMAYVHERAVKLRGFRWRAGKAIPPDVQRRMAPEELHFAEQYNLQLSEYMSGRHASDDGVDGVDILGEIDLTLDVVLPPKEPYIHVLVKEDRDDIVTEDGKVIQLKRGSRHFMRRCDAEPLVVEGVLQHVEA